MEILAFTDFHGNQEAFRRAKERIADEKPDLVIVAGDIINYDFNAAKRQLGDLASVGPSVYFVPGNMDSGCLGVWIGQGNVHGLHGRCEYCKGVALIGLGGSPHGPFRTIFEFSEEEAAELLNKALKDYRRDKLILVSHCPPKDKARPRLQRRTCRKHLSPKVRRGESARASCLGAHSRSTRN